MMKGDLKFQMLKNKFKKKNNNKLRIKKKAN
jgi:hypothetical protein